ncbi:DUF421 domain-containing protein [Domibacillus robiginosus]|uniref:DUF421 domain-containing protein n=1 Tax=Domibacillus robiginosus TaxID=1071054 RepID=UPI00067B3C03|nr:DUF421 domain-containing protein [Domibacillus robiginosus]
MPILELLLRLMLAFLVLLALTRIMGRKEIAQMTFVNFISAIVLGTLGAALAIDPSLSLLNGLTALISWSAFTVLLGYLDIKSKKVRKIITGQPVILIKNGKIMESALRKVRVDMESLSSLLRKKDVFAISDVDYAIFETDGSLSVMKKTAKQPVTKKDLNIPEGPYTFPMPAAVISDGIVNSRNLEKLKLDLQWLDQQLQAANIWSLSDVFYAEVQQDGSLYIDQRRDDSAVQR